MHWNIYTTDAQKPLLLVSALLDDGNQGLPTHVGRDFVHLFLYILVHVRLLLYIAMLCFGNTHHDQQSMYSRFLVPDSTRRRV